MLCFYILTKKETTLLIAKERERGEKAIKKTHI